MATTYNIVEKRYNGTDYDTLYPATKGENLVSPVPVELGGTGATTGAAGLINLASDVPIRDDISSPDLLSFGSPDGTPSLSSVARVPFNALFAMAVEAVTIMQGAYEGTGTYGSSNPCEITLGDVGNRSIAYVTVIKMSEGGNSTDQNIVVSSESWGGDIAVPVNRFSVFSVSDVSTSYDMYIATNPESSDHEGVSVSFNDSGFKYYSNDSAAAQLNESGANYVYYAVLTHA